MPSILYLRMSKISSYVLEGHCWQISQSWDIIVIILIGVPCSDFVQRTKRPTSILAQKNSDYQLVERRAATKANLQHYRSN